MRTGPSRVHDVAVLGGGVAGLSLTRALARAGADVVLLERTALGSAPFVGSAPIVGSPSGGASALPVALLNPWRGRKGAAHPGDLRGLATTWRWADELTAEGLDAGASRSGVVRIATSARQARDWSARAAPEPSLRWHPPGALPEPYHAPFGALLVRDGGRIDAPRWLAALAASARSSGAELRSGVEVTDLAQRADDVWELRGPAGHDGGDRANNHASRDPAAGDRTDSDRTDSDRTSAAAVARARLVVTCVGADALPSAATHDGHRIAWPEWRRTRGEVVTLAGGPSLPWPVAGGVYGAADDGTAWVGGGHRRSGQDDPSAPDRIRTAFAWFAPAMADADVTAVWSGVRAKRADARPDVQRVAPGLWTFGAFAGRGFLCAGDEADRWAALWWTGELDGGPTRPPGG